MIDLVTVNHCVKCQVGLADAYENIKKSALYRIMVELVDTVVSKATALRRKSSSLFNPTTSWRRG